MAAYYTSDLQRQVQVQARRLALKLAKELGVTVTAHLSGGWHEVLLDAPDGSCFAGELHQLVIANAGAVTDGLWQSALQQLQDMPVVKCTTANCEVCGS